MERTTGLYRLLRVKRVCGFCFNEFYSFRKSPSPSAQSSLEPEQAPLVAGSRPFFVRLMSDNGADDRTRTGDVNLGKVAFYH